MSKKITGSCMCGKIKYEIDLLLNQDNLTTIICNCFDCQKQTGSSYSVVTAVARKSLSFVNNLPSSYEMIANSGGKSVRYFCNNCGSPIYSDVESTPDVFWIKQGTLDDTSIVNPTLSIFMNASQNWVKLDDTITKFETMPTG